MYLNSSEPKLLYKKDGSIFLKLPDNAKGNNFRYVGKLKGDTLFTGKKYKEAHLFLRYSSVGIPELLFESNKEIFKYICMNYENDIYWTSVYALLLKGELVSFSQYKFEVQVHLPLTSWKRTKAEAKEQRKKIRNGEITK